MVSSMQSRGTARADIERAYDEFLEPIFRYFYWRLGDRDRAKDLAQETFVRAWDYLRKGNAISSMKPFLYTAAGNIFKNELRGRKPVVSLDALRVEGFDPPLEETSAEERLEAKLLMQKVDRLAPPQREILLLRYADGLSIGEIAEALDITNSATSVRIHRALAALREIHTNP